MNPENPRVTEARALYLSARRLLKAVSLVEVKKRIGSQQDIDDAEADADIKSNALKAAIQAGKTKLKL